MSEEPILSEFADDADMSELLKEFADGLSETCQNLRDGLEAGDIVAVRRIGHQLKGAGGGYGYPLVSEVGASLESAVDQNGAIDDAVRARAEELIEVCRRVQAGSR